MMPIPTLIAAELDLLRRYNTPTISNAIETLQRPQAAPRLLAAHDSLPVPRPGADRRIRGDRRRRGPHLPRTLAGRSPADYFRYVAAQPGPKIAVGQDLDNPPGLGAQFGEVTATIHKKLGCVGHITDGCPRDLDEVQALGFQLFGAQPLRQPCLCPAGRLR